jgi:hypothetical protein
MQIDRRQFLAGALIAADPPEPIRKLRPMSGSVPSIADDERWLRIEKRASSWSRTASRL